MLLGIYSDMVTWISGGEYKIGIPGGSLVAVDGRIFGSDGIGSEYS